MNNQVTSNEHPTNIRRTSNEDPTNIQQTSNDHPTKIRPKAQRTSSEHPTKIQQKSNEHPTNIHRTSSEHPRVGGSKSRLFAEGAGWGGRRRVGTVGAGEEGGGRRDRAVGLSGAVGRIRTPVHTRASLLVGGAGGLAPVFTRKANAGWVCWATGPSVHGHFLCSVAGDGTWIGVCMAGGSKSRG